MEVTFYGTGSASPHLERSPSGCVVNLGNESILIDCGEGTQYRFLQHKVKHSRIRTICITHLHGDHYFGLIGLLSSLNLNSRKEPIQIFAPKGLEEIIRLQFEASGTQISFPLTFNEVDTTKSDEIYRTNTFIIKSIPLRHRVPCCGFLISTLQSKRKIVKSSLPADFPIPYFRKLQNGEDVLDELSGRLYKNTEHTTKGTAEKSFAYCSDTAYYEPIIELIKGCNLLYHEATFTKELEDRAEKTQHSTAEQAAKIASKAKVGKLLIAHFSSRYKSLDPFIDEARQIFKPTEIVIEAFKYIV